MCSDESLKLQDEKKKVWHASRQKRLSTRTSSRLLMNAWVGTFVSEVRQQLMGPKVHTCPKLGYLEPLSWEFQIGIWKHQWVNCENKDHTDRQTWGAGGCHWSVAIQQSFALRKQESWFAKGIIDNNNNVCHLLCAYYVTGVLLSSLYIWTRS